MLPRQYDICRRLATVAMVVVVAIAGVAGSLREPLADGTRADDTRRVPATYFAGENLRGKRIIVSLRIQPPPGKQPPKTDPEPEEPVFEKLDEMLEKLPSVKQLLTEDPVDWVVLKNLDVLVVLPVSPRPSTLEKIELRIEEARKAPRPRTKKEQEDQRAEHRKLPFLYVTLKDGGADPLRRIHYRNLRQKVEVNDRVYRGILHHEDLLLIRIAILQDEGKLAQAFELLFNLKRRKPDWPGIQDFEKRHLLTEARVLMKEDRLGTALVRLEELFGRDPKYRGTSALFGDVVDRLTTRALKTKDYRRARHYLGRLATRISSHDVYKKWRDELQKQATEKLALANTASTAGKHDDAERLIRQAAEIWPNTPQIASAFGVMTHRFQRLRVGVRQLPGEPTPFFLPTLADDRHRFLTETRLFEPHSLDSVVNYQTRYFSQWDPTDLGRLTVFRLQTDRPYWLPQPVVSASLIARNLRYRLNPNSPDYDERLASYIRSVRVDSPTTLRIRFSRVPPRLESVFRFPLRETDRWKPGSGDGKAAGVSPPLISQRFAAHRKSNWTARRRFYRRYRPEPDKVQRNRYHVAEIEEVKFDSDAAIIQALKRGRIDLMPHVRPYDRRRLARDSRLQVRGYSLPVTHVLQFNPDSPAMANREFRKALFYALDRQGMLNSLILRTHAEQDNSSLGRVVSAPFSSRGYAYDPTVKPKKHNITLAFALAIAVRKQYERANVAAVGVGLAAIVVRRGEKRGWIPKLNLLVAPGDGPKKVAIICVRQWRRIGIKVQIVTAGKRKQQNPPAWDIMYRTVRMVDPVVDLWPFLTFDNRARVARLKPFPDWLRQELIRVDMARDWSAAVQTLRALHKHLAEERHLIPLFEVDDFFAYRKELAVFRSENVDPVSTYQNIERWTIRPKYPKQFP